MFRHGLRYGDRHACSLDAFQRAAFERYVLPEIEVLLRVAHSLTRNHADAEDLVQDTLVRAYRAIDRFDGRCAACLVGHHLEEHTLQPQPPSTP